MQQEARAAAAKVAERGRAEADALKRLLSEYKAAGHAAREVLVLQQLMPMVQSIAGADRKVRIDEWAVVPSGGSSGDGLVQKAIAASEQIRAATGVDLARVAGRVSGGSAASATPATPPPPPNQIVYVKLEKGIDNAGRFAPVWVTGEMAVKAATKNLYLVDGSAGINVGYSLEASQVEHSSSARFVHGRRVNLRAGPSTSEEVLLVLDESTPVFTERSERGWTMVRTLSGRVGWIHDSLLRSER